MSKTPVEQDSLFDLSNWIWSQARTRGFQVVLAWAFMVVGPLLVYRDIFFGENLFWGNGTASLQIFPRFAVDQALIRAGHLPQYWNFGLFTGVPWVAGGNSTQYPVYVLLLKFLSIRGAHAWYLLLHMYAAIAGFALLLRREGLGWSPCAIAGLMYVCAGPIPYLLITGHYEPFVCVCLWPLLCAFGSRLSESRPSWIAYTFCMWLCWVSGALDYAILGIAVSVVFCLRKNANWYTLLSTVLAMAISSASVADLIWTRVSILNEAELRFVGESIGVARPGALFSILNLNYLYPTSIRDHWFPWFDGLCQLGSTCLCLPLLLCDSTRFSRERRLFWWVTGVAVVMGFVFSVHKWSGILPSGRQFWVISFFLLLWQVSVSLEQFLALEPKKALPTGLVIWTAFWALVSVLLCYLPTEQNSVWTKFLCWFTTDDIGSERSQGILAATYLRTCWMGLLASILWLARSLESRPSKAILLVLVIALDLQVALYPMIVTATADLFALPTSTENMISQLGAARVLLPRLRQGQALSLGNCELQGDFSSVYSFQDNKDTGQALLRFSDKFSKAGFEVFSWLGGRYLLSSKPLVDSEAQECLRELSADPVQEQYFYETRRPKLLVELATDWENSPDFVAGKITVSRAVEASHAPLTSEEGPINMVLDSSGLQTQLKLNATRLVCVRIAYSRNLRHSLDGQPVEAFPVSGGLFTGIVCPTGSHHLEIGQPTVGRYHLLRWLGPVCLLAMLVVFTLDWLLQRLSRLVLIDEPTQAEHGESNGSVDVGTEKHNSSQTAAIPEDPSHIQPDVNAQESAQQD